MPNTRATTTKARAKELEVLRAQFREALFGPSGSKNNTSLPSRQVVLVSPVEYLFLLATDEGEIISAPEQMEWALFDMAYHSESKEDDVVSFRSSLHGYYLCAEGNNRVVCNRALLGPWEKFKVQPVEKIDDRNFKVALHTWNGHILSLVGPNADVLALDTFPRYHEDPSHQRRDNEHFIISFVDVPEVLKSTPSSSVPPPAADPGADAAVTTAATAAAAGPRPRVLERQLSEMHKEIVGTINSGSLNLCFVTAPVFGVLFSTVGLDDSMLLVDRLQRQTSGNEPRPTVPAAEWVTVAQEGEEFECVPQSRVRYGFGAHWVERIVSGRVPARNDVFGDPAPGVVKVLQLLQVSGQNTSQAAAASNSGKAPQHGTVEAEEKKLHELKGQLTDLFHKARGRTFLTSECALLRRSFRAAAKWCENEPENRQQDSLDFFLKLLEYTRVPDFFTLNKQTFHGGLPAEHDSGVDHSGHAIFLDVPHQGRTHLKALLYAYMERTTPPVKRKVARDDAGEELTNTLQIFSFDKTPRFLIVALKRFTQPGIDARAGRKLKTFVDVPFLLPTRLEDLVIPDETEAMRKSPAERGLLSLRMVVCHHGRTPNSGHYTCYYFDRETHALSHFDDLMDAEQNPDVPLGGTRRVKYEDVRASIATDGYFALYETLQQQQQQRQQPSVGLSEMQQVTIESKEPPAESKIGLAATPPGPGPGPAAKVSEPYVSLLDRHLRTKRDLQLARLELADHMRVTNASGFLLPSPMLRRGVSGRRGFGTLTPASSHGVHAAPTSTDQTAGRQVAQQPHARPQRFTAATLPTAARHSAYLQEQITNACNGLVPLLMSGNAALELSGVKALSALLSSTAVISPLKTDTPLHSALRDVSARGTGDEATESASSLAKSLLASHFTH